STLPARLLTSSARYSTIERPFSFSLIRPRPRSTLFPYTTLFRSVVAVDDQRVHEALSDHNIATVMTDSRHESGTERAAEVARMRSEEHTSELQSRENLVCRLLLEKKKLRAARQK